MLKCWTLKSIKIRTLVKNLTILPLVEILNVWKSQNIFSTVKLEVPMNYYFTEKKMKKPQHRRSTMVVLDLRVWECSLAGSLTLKFVWLKDPSLPFHPSTSIHPVGRPVSWVSKGDWIQRRIKSLNVCMFFLLAVKFLSCQQIVGRALDGPIWLGDEMVGSHISVYHCSMVLYFSMWRKVQSK